MMEMIGRLDIRFCYLLTEARQYAMFGDEIEISSFYREIPMSEFEPWRAARVIAPTRKPKARIVSDLNNLRLTVEGKIPELVDDATKIMRVSSDRGFDIDSMISVTMFWVDEHLIEADMPAVTEALGLQPELPQLSNMAGYSIMNTGIRLEGMRNSDTDRVRISLRPVFSKGSKACFSFIITKPNLTLMLEVLKDLPKWLETLGTEILGDEHAIRI